MARDTRSNRSNRFTVPLYVLAAVIVVALVIFVALLVYVDTVSR